MPGHIVSSYDTDLENLRRSISEMGGVAEKMTAEATDALVRRDDTLAQAVILADKRLDALQRDIEERAVLLIARRQPLAIDLRETISAIRVSGDLERIGDLAEGQLKDVLDAYASRDIESARDVWERDGEIDALYNSLFRELLTYMMEDPRNISFCTHLLFCAKNVERIGDHTTNIAETIHYLATGETLAGDRPKNDASNYATVDGVPAP